jgi:hypothetical protein
MKIGFIILLIAFSISCSADRTNKSNPDLNAPSEIKPSFDAITVKQELENSYLFW